MRGSRNFCQFHLVLSLFYSLKRGSNGFIAEKIILYQGSRGGPLYSGGGVSNFFWVGGGGVQMLISIETHIRTYFPGGGCPVPLASSGGGGGGGGGGSPNANFYRNPYKYLLFSRGRVSGPPILLWIRTWAMSS